MIFVEAKTEPTVFIMLSEKDIDLLRRGHTRFADGAQINARPFTKVVLSLHKTDDEAMRLISRQQNIQHINLVAPQAKADEEVCSGCQGIMRLGSLFEGRCIVCWANKAKHGGSVEGI